MSGEPKYPEHQKLKAVKEESQVIGAFLEWFLERMHEGCQSRAHMSCTSGSIEETVAKYLGIDTKKLRDEKWAMEKECHAAIASTSRQVAVKT